MTGTSSQTQPAVFRQFIEATVALLSHPDTPALVYNLISDAITEIGNHGANDEPDGVLERRILERAFGLPLTPM